MAIADVITTMNEHTKAAYDALEAKGAELPAHKNLENLAEVIENLPAGGDYGTVTIKNEDGTTTEVPLDLIGFLGTSKSLASDDWEHPDVDIVINGVVYKKSQVVAYDTGDNLDTILPYMFGGSYYDQEQGEQIGYFPNLESIRLGANISKIAEGFVAESKVPLQNLEIVAAQEIGNYFGRNSSINLPITLPDTVVKIGNGFLSSTENYNSELILSSSLQEIGKEFLAYSRSYTQTLTLPASITQIGFYFMFNTDSVTSLVTNTSTVPTDPYETNDRYTLATNSSGQPIFDIGVTITGTGADAWRAALPNQVISPFRNIIGNPMPEPYIEYWTNSNGENSVKVYDSNQAQNHISGRYSWNKFPSDTTKIVFHQPCEELTGISTAVFAQGLESSLENIEGMEYLATTTTLCTFQAFNQLRTIGEFPPNLKFFTLSNVAFIDCPLFNQPLTMPTGQQAIPDSQGKGWIDSCPSFNSPITISTYPSETRAIINNCASFNQPITFGFTSYTHNTLVSNCPAFNQPITLPDVSEDFIWIFGDLILNCENFASTITFPKSVSFLSASGNLLQNLPKFTRLEIHGRSVQLPDTVPDPWFSVYSSGSVPTLPGITIATPNATSVPLWGRITDLNGPYYYRKITLEDLPASA